MIQTPNDMGGTNTDETIGLGGTLATDQPNDLPAEVADKVLRLGAGDKITVYWAGVLSQKAGQSMTGFIASDFCILFVCKGKLCVKIDGRPFTTEKGQTLLVWPSETIVGAEPQQDHLLCQWLNFNVQHSRPRKNDDVIEVPRMAGSRNFERTAELFRMITEDYHSLKTLVTQTYEPLDDFGTRCLLLSLFSKLKTENPAANGKSSALTILAECGKDYIRTHYREPITTEDVAEALDCSARYLRKAFQHTYGFSPTSFVCAMRMVTARYELSETRKPVGQIARDCGFTTHEYFTRVFRNHEGVTPVQYRMNHSRKHVVADI